MDAREAKRLQVRDDVLKLDGYRCRNFMKRHDRTVNLTVHHFKKRSHCGPDHIRWEITFCMGCHTQVDETGCEEMTPRQYEIKILKDLEMLPDFRWDEALEYLEGKEALKCLPSVVHS